MFTLWDDTSENSNHPDSANEALRHIAQMLFTLTTDNENVSVSVRVSNMESRTIRMCTLWGVEARRPKFPSGGYTWDSMQPKLLRHVTEIASCLAERKEKTFTIYAEWASKMLRDMCELLDLEIVESKPKHTPPERNPTEPPTFETPSEWARRMVKEAEAQRVWGDRCSSSAFDPGASDDKGTPCNPIPKETTINVTNVIDPVDVSNYMHSDAWARVAGNLRKALGPKSTPPHLQPITINPGETAAWLFGEGGLQCRKGEMKFGGEWRKTYEFRLHPHMKRDHIDAPIPKDERSNAPAVAMAFADDAAILRLARDLIDLAQR